MRSRARREPQPSERALSLADLARFGVLGTLLAVLCGQLLTLDGAARATATERPSLPQVDARCREPPERALAWAREAELSAIARIERYRFSPSSGLPALELLAQAESCARLAEHAELGERLALRKQALNARLELDLATALERSAVARRRGPRSALKADLQFLLALLERQDTDFTHSLRRELASLIEATPLEPKASTP